MDEFLEKRKTKRVPIHVKVVGLKEDKDFCFSYARDISAEGIAISPQIYLREDKNLKIGDLLKLKFKLPQGKNFLTIHAFVLRIDHESIALKFKDLIPDFQNEINNYININSIII